MQPSPRKIRADAGAIRLLDVAAIVCVAGVLAFLLFLYLGHNKDRALRVKCEGNFRQIATALSLYSKDNHDLLPDCSAANPRFSGPLWPWDISTNLTSDLEARGATRQVFYCPANPAMNDERHWNFWRNNPGTTRVIGYGMLFKGMGQVPRNLWRLNLNGDGQSSPADTELSFDATASVDDDYTRIQGIWVDRSNHMRDKTPLGGNILFEDQHVEWRNFDEMSSRFRTIGPGGPIEWNF